MTSLSCVSSPGTSSTTSISTSTLSPQVNNVLQSTAPSLETIEKLLEIENAIQIQIADHLAAVSRGLERDINVTKKCIYFDSACSSRNSLVAMLEDTFESHGSMSEQASGLKDKAHTLRSHFSVLKRQVAVIEARHKEENAKIRDMKAGLAKVDRILNEAVRLLGKLDGHENPVIAPMASTPKRTRPSSGVRLNWSED